MSDKSENERCKRLLDTATGIVLAWDDENLMPELEAHVEELRAAIQECSAPQRPTKPLLGLASTAELLKELQARAELGGYATYRTVGCVYCYSHPCECSPEERLRYE